MIDRFVEFTSAVSTIYKAIQKIERQEMEKYGLQGPHVQCLVEVSRQSEGISAARLCEICEKNKASVSRSLSTLEKKGLISRETGYRGKITLTSRGESVTGQILNTARRCVEAVSLDFGEQERAAFHRNLQNIAQNLLALSTEGAER